MNKIEIEKGQIVYLFWLDSTNLTGGWHYLGDTFRAVPKEIETVGFVLDISDTAVTISSTQSNSGGNVDPLTIPLGCIQDYKLLDIR